jgi:hypothetical protein
MLTDQLRCLVVVVERVMEILNLDFIEKVTTHEELGRETVRHQSDYRDRARL